MILQLDPPICLHTKKGKGFAHFLIDYGIETDLYWVVFLNETGECWTFSNTEIRIENNITIGRQVSPLKPESPCQPPQSESQSHQSQPLQRPLSSGSVMPYNQLDTDPLRIRS